MPVLVTGAETGLGRATVRALRRVAGELRVYLDAEVVTDDDAQGYRRLGCKTAVGELDDEGRLELALEQVHTVVHCWGGPLVAPDTELDTLAVVVSAAIGARCRRVVWPSHLGADDPGDSAYLTACREAEGLLADAPLESVVLRRALTYGPDDELTRRLASTAPDAGAAGRARHAPLAIADLAAALVQADRMDRGGVRTDLALVLELAGPEVVPLREVVAGLRAAGLAPPQAAAPLPPWTAALYARDLVPRDDVAGRGGTPLARGTAVLPPR